MILYAFSSIMFVKWFLDYCYGKYFWILFDKLQLFKISKNWKLVMSKVALLKLSYNIAQNWRTGGKDINFLNSKYRRESLPCRTSDKNCYFSQASSKCFYTHGGSHAVWICLSKFSCKKLMHFISIAVDKFGGLLLNL